MLKTRLQNNLNNVDIPPKKLSFSLALENSTTFVKILMPLCVILFCGLSVVILPVAGVLISGLVEGKPLSQLINFEVMSSIHVIIAIVVWLVTIILFLFIHRRIRLINLKEQTAYYKLGQVPELNAEQAAAMRLNIVDDYSVGGWGETLEYYPCEVRINDKDKHFRFLQFVTRNQERQHLDKWWGIVSAKQYKEMISKLYDGLHTSLFVEEIDGDDRDAMLERLAGLIQKPESYILKCNEQNQQQPKKLIWGFDLLRIISLSRSAYIAGYIEENEAWSEILHAAELIHYVFDDFDDFYNNYRLGNAFWSNNFDTAREKLEMWQGYNANCDWPASKLAWPKVDSVDMPEVMQQNFSQQSSSKLGFV